MTFYKDTIIFYILTELGGNEHHGHKIAFLSNFAFHKMKTENK